jgi:hypothetical protein
MRMRVGSGDEDESGEGVRGVYDRLRGEILRGVGMSEGKGVWTVTIEIRGCGEGCVDLVGVGERGVRSWWVDDLG